MRNADNKAVSFRIFSSVKQVFPACLRGVLLFVLIVSPFLSQARNPIGKIVGVLSDAVPSSASATGKKDVVITDVHIQSNNSNPAFAKQGDVIKISFTASETIHVFTATIAGQAATAAANVSGNNWEATKAVTNGTNQGTVAFKIEYLDNLNNTGTITAVTDASVVNVSLVFNTLDRIGLGAGQTAKAAFSLRRMSSSYNGNLIQVRRSIDDALLDIGFDANGVLDTVALKSFVGSGDGFVTTWYDQSGIAPNHAYQSLVAMQPQVVIGGVLQTLAGVPVLNFNADHLDITAKTSDVGIFNRNFEYNVVAAVSPTGTRRTFIKLNNTFNLYNLDAGPFPGNIARFSLNDNQNATVSAGLNFGANRPTIVGGRYDGTNAIARKDGTDGTPVATIFFTSDGPLAIGGNATGTFFTGFMNEVLVFSNNINSDRASLEANQQAYYFFPQLSNVNIQSDRANHTLATAGDIVTLHFTANKPLQVPTVTIAGVGAVVTNTSGYDWQAAIAVTGSIAEVVGMPFTISFADMNGNTGTLTTTTDASAVTLYKSPPSITDVHIQTNNAHIGYARYGDVATISFKATTFIQTPTITLAGLSASVTKTSAYDWQATVTINQSVADGVAAMSIIVTDLAGNAAAAFTQTTDASYVTVDNVILVPTPVTFQSNNQSTAYAKQGNTVNLLFTSQELIATSVVTIGGLTAVVANTSGNSWKASVTVDNTFSEGVVLFNAVVTDLAGNSISFSTTTTAGVVTVDNITPVLNIVHIESNNGIPSLAPLNSLITVSFTANEALLSTTLIVDGKNVNMINTSGNNWQGSHPVVSTSAEGNAFFEIAFKDMAGNTGTNVTATTDASAVTIERTAPTLTSIHIKSSNSNSATAQPGDVLTLSFTASEPIRIPLIKIAGETANITNTSGNNWEATLTVSSITQQGVAGIKVFITDVAGNTGVTPTGTTDASNVFIGMQTLVSSFSPAVGTTGAKQGWTMVTVTGSGFSATADKNIVFFGAVSCPATTVNANGTVLTVRAPVGATNQHLGVLNKETGLTGYAYLQAPFAASFYNEGNMQFSTTADYAYNYSPVGNGNYFKIADIDGDGKPDFVVVNNNKSVSVLRNISSNSAVSFDTANITNITFNYQVQSLAIGDMDGDGKQDLVVLTDANPGSEIRVYPNTSTTGNVSFGQWSSTPQVPAFNTVAEISLTDVDGDGKTDICLPYGLGIPIVGVYILRNNYTAADGLLFVTTNYYSTSGNGKWAKGMVRGDFNADGKVDLAVTSFASVTASSDSSLVRVFYNNSTLGTPAFSASYQSSFFMGIGYAYAEALKHSTVIASGDLDKDGKPDIASANYAAGGGNFAVLLNNTTANTFAFNRTTTAFNTTPPGNIAMSDMDGDGKLDLAFLFEASNSIFIFRNNSLPGNVRFGNRISVPTATTTPQYMEFCDLDGDGIPDLVTANASGLAVQKGIGKTSYLPMRLPF